MAASLLEVPRTAKAKVRSRPGTDARMEKAKADVQSSLLLLGLELERVCILTLWRLARENPFRDVSFCSQDGLWDFRICGVNGPCGADSRRVEPPVCRELN